MTLGDKQRLFFRLLPRLLDKVIELSYEGTTGDAFRDPRVHGEIGVRRGYGHPKSAHKNKLAIDINLFKDGRYITDDEGHREIGEWWVQQHPLCRCGSSFGDYNHYSIEHNGVI